MFRATGAVASLDALMRGALLDRSTSSDAAVREVVTDIISRVRKDGDDALHALAREYDSAELERLEVPRSAWRAALEETPTDLRSAMERAAANIRTAHQAFLPRAIEIETEPGITVGRRPDPLGRVGIYAPGGRAAYPSSVLMGAIPARVAGVHDLVLCSPPDVSGAPAAVVLAAAELAGVDRVFALGGAGAVAAMAYGTGTVPRVDRIVGPGNAYVAEAKLQVAGVCAIDSPAGPSELLVIVDSTASPEVVAREMLAQAEHDPRACVVAVAVGDGVASALASALERTLGSQPRREIIRAAFADHGALLVAADEQEAIDFANDYAAEHLLLALRDPREMLERVRSAGTVFLGESSSVAFGDYMTGANHVLPTGGLARSYAGLSTLDFVRWTSHQRVTPEAAARMANDVGIFATAEGLPSHAAAAEAWATPASSAGRASGGVR